MKAFKILTASVLTLCSSIAVMASEDPTDFSALTGEYVASNPGLEIAVPSWTRVDNNGDAIKDGYNFRFDVYKLGTKTKLFSTPVRYLPDTLSACELPNLNFSLGDRNIGFNRIGNNVVVSTWISVLCQPFSLKYSGHVYAVNISAAGKTPWVKSFSTNLLGTGILPDKNGNGIAELSVITKSYPLGGSPDAPYIDNTIYVYDGETGASLAAPQKYAIER